jgi:alpha-tubulin suppressor-like RCC1 family protein/tRNA A-37 threonylcarbamoyl transferase component Bud32
MLGDTEANVATTDLESDYEILGELGRGATAVVYRARDRELGREVAIKVIRPKFADDDETVARLAREARTVAQLQHPNIVTLFAVRRMRDGGLALVMQLVPGRTLRDILNERGPWSFERADRVLRDVAGALAHAHNRGIVHRDVKPENIFIDETTGHALLSDFGVARSIEADSQLTATGTAIGTPAYMSPEQIDGGELDGRSDLYSLGLVGWEMLTGRRPWEGESLYSVIYKQKREELPPIDELRSDTPDRLIYLVEGSTRKSPSDRWRSANEFLEQASTISPEGGWARWHAERRKRRRSMIYAAARDRGESIVSAALETVRFRRDMALPQGEAVRQPTRAATSAAAMEALTAEDEKATRRSLVPVFVVIVLVIAGLGAGAKLIRGRIGPVVATNPPTTFADNGGIEVPVAKPPAPNVPAVVTSPDSVIVQTDKQPARLSVDSEPKAAEPQSTDSKLADAKRAEPTAPAPERTTAPRDQRSTSGGEVSPPVSRPTVSTSGSSTAPPSSTATLAAAPPRILPQALPTSDSERAAPRAEGSVSFPSDRATVAAGGRHSCALDESGHAACWGANDLGQLGDGSHEDHTGAVVVAGDLTFAQISAGASHTCGVTKDGDAYCWGNNDRGQLGDATTLQRDTPVRVGAAGPFKTVRAGFGHSCALSRSGTISCWGSNAYGQLGTGGGLTSARPGDVEGNLRFGAMAVGWNHTCGVTNAGEVYCWGSNNSGQLGDGTRDDRRTPARVASSQRFVAVAAGNQHTCGVTTVGEVYCWGRNNFGQLATGPGDRSQPGLVEATGVFTGITAGAVHTCGRTTAGLVFCWGRNTFGQLGDGTTTDRPAPVRVVGLSGAATVQASGAHTCAATSTGEDFCWGYNVEGQLGDGSRNHRSRPVRVDSSPR